MTDTVSALLYVPHFHLNNLPLDVVRADDCNVCKAMEVMEVARNVAEMVEKTNRETKQKQKQGDGLIAKETVLIEVEGMKDMRV